jgi:uncharacterized delta-60 repeat protein
MVYKSFQRPVRSHFISELVMERPRRVRVMLALMLIALLASPLQPARVRAADGDLDPGFGNGGTVTTDFLRGGDDQANAVVLQKDEKIVVAGGNSGNFAVARYNPDGGLDTSFGNGGRVITAFGNNRSSAHALALQSDGKIVVAGAVMSSVTGSDFALARYNTDGSLDTSFDGDGKVTTHISDISNGNESANAVAIQPADGKIIAAGSTENSSTRADFALARYNMDGSLDTSFDGDGKVVTAFFSDLNEGINSVALQPDGRIVAAGSFVLARYNLDGSLDTKFGNGGSGFVLFGATASDVALQPDGKIVIVTFSSAEFSRFVVARYTPEGSLDGSFGTGGIVITNLGDFTASRALALQSDGKIVVFGDNALFFLLARYNSNGTLDTGFGNNGIESTQISNAFGCNGFDVAIQPGDGKIVAVGVSRSIPLGADFAMARYHEKGSLDISFDDDGIVTTDWPGGPDVCNAVVIQPDGKIVVAGGCAGDFALARYNPDGSLDASFGNGGRVITDFVGGADRAQAVALQADGKIVAAGLSSPLFQLVRTDFALARYNTDGSLDASFDGDGKVTTDFAGDDDEVRAVALQGDGKIVAAGGTFFGRQFALARYNTDGILDTTFDGDGKLVTSLGSDSGSAYGIVIQPGDGKLVAAGGADADFGLVRYNPDGSLDLSFDGDGKVATSFMVRDRARAIGLQPDGKIVAAGFAQPGFTEGTGNGDFALARYNTDGSLDTTFDGDGKVTTNISDVSRDDQAHGVIIQPRDGRIVAAGYAQNGAGIVSPSDFALARYNPDGSLDTSFGGDGTITTNIGNSSTAFDQAHGVAIQPDDGKIIAVGETFNNGTGTDFALARYDGGGDIIPPTIACPTGIQVVTPRPLDACAAVVYPPPVVGDNLPGATVVCAPPSGSCFPVGTTTVTCTATDAAGNTAACSFTVTAFDVLLQSDSDPNAELLINSFTGDYSFCCPLLPAGQSPLRGRGQARTHGSTITLTHIAETFRLVVNIDAAVGKGTASFKPVSGHVLCPIQDRNIFDNLPVLCGNVSP